MHITSSSVQKIGAKDLFWCKKAWWHWSYHQVGRGIVFLCHLKLGRSFSKCWGYHHNRFSCCNPMTFCKDIWARDWRLLNLYRPLCTDSSWVNCSTPRIQSNCFISLISIRHSKMSNLILWLTLFIQKIQE